MNRQLSVVVLGSMKHSDNCYRCGVCGINNQIRDVRKEYLSGAINSSRLAASRIQR